MQWLFTGAIPLLISTGVLTCSISDLGEGVHPSLGNLVEMYLIQAVKMSSFTSDQAKDLPIFHQLNMRGNIEGNLFALSVAI